MLVESLTFDAKAGVAAGEKANRNLAIDLAATAVSGGLIAAGVAQEEANGAKVLVPRPVALAGLRERVSPIGLSRVDPPLTVDTRELSTDDAGNGYLLILVPPSPDAPHMGDNKYRGRADTTNYVLGDADVRRIQAQWRQSRPDVRAALARAIERDPTDPNHRWVRDADAHRAYEQLADGVALNSTRTVAGREVSGEELIDLVLAATESCMVLHTAVTCAMTAQGIAIEDLDSASELLPFEGKMAFLLSAAGLRDVSVQDNAGTVEIRGAGSLSPPQVLSTTAAIAGVVASDAQRVQFSMTDPHGAKWTASGPLGPFRDVIGSDGIRKEAATVEAAAKWRVRGSPVFSQGFVRKWAARRVALASIQDPSGVGSVIETIAHMAKRIDDGRLQSTLNAYGRLMQARASQVPVSAKDKWAFDQIADWVDDGDPPGGTMAPA